MSLRDRLHGMRWRKAPDRKSTDTPSEVIRILGISGSPRRDGNTAYMLRAALNGASDFLKWDVHVCPECDLIQLSDYYIADCLACDTCKGMCRLTDNMGEACDKMIEADGLIIGSPVYFGTMTGLLKRFLDRTRILRHNDFQLADKPCGFVAVAARRNGGQETTIMEMLTVMLRHGCVIVNNGPPTSQYGATGWAGPMGEVETDSFGIDTAYGVGERVARIAYLLKTGQLALKDPLPPYEFDTVSGTRRREQGGDRQ